MSVCQAVATYKYESIKCLKMYHRSFGNHKHHLSTVAPVFDVVVFAAADGAQERNPERNRDHLFAVVGHCGPVNEIYRESYFLV